MDLSTQAARDRFRWPIARSVDIAAPVTDVWRAISEPGNLVASHLEMSRLAAVTKLVAVLEGVRSLKPSLRQVIQRNREEPENQNHPSAAP